MFTGLLTCHCSKGESPPPTPTLQFCNGTQAFFLIYLFIYTLLPETAAGLRWLWCALELINRTVFDEWRLHLALYQHMIEWGCVGCGVLADKKKCWTVPMRVLSTVTWPPMSFRDYERKLGFLDSKLDRFLDWIPGIGLGQPRACSQVTKKSKEINNTFQIYMWLPGLWILQAVLPAVSECSAVCKSTL